MSDLERLAKELQKVIGEAEERIAPVGVMAARLVLEALRLSLTKPVPVKTPEPT